uniref:Apple domain-containing protein n=1 Tax=Brugia pahangi TaxID=6280 RepID=A0A0N4TIE0_BRUPA
MLQHVQVIAVQRIGSEGRLQEIFETGRCSTGNIQAGRSCRDFSITNYSEHWLITCYVQTDHLYSEECMFHSGRNLTDPRSDLSSQTVLNDGKYRDGVFGDCEGG